jgi:hypothetical protein
MRDARARPQFIVSTGLARLPLAEVELDPSRHRPDDVLGILGPWLEGIDRGQATKLPILD